MVHFAYVVFNYLNYNANFNSNTHYKKAGIVCWVSINVLFGDYSKLKLWNSRLRCYNIFRKAKDFLHLFSFSISTIREMFEVFVNTYRKWNWKENLWQWNRKSKCLDSVWQAIGIQNQPEVSAIFIPCHQSKRDV